MSQIRTRDLLKTSLRLTLLQSTWCESSMQSIGLAYSLIPALSQLHNDDESLASAFERFKLPFNTHPFMAGFLAGAALNLEENGSSAQMLNGFMRGAMGPMAAIGDPFFRSALPHLVAVIASFVAIWFGALAGAVTLLLLFNSFHLAIRVRGVFIGYHGGINVLPKIARWLSPARTKAIQTITALGAGAVIVTIAIEYGSGQPLWIAVAAISTILMALALVKWPSARRFFIPLLLAAVFLIEVFI